jgi:surfeit locus 1 family protein
LVALAAGAIVLFLGFIALGSWQVERRAWKLDLISRVEHRVHAPAAAAPGREHWQRLSVANDEYRHVWVTGIFLAASDTLVQATTERGAGYWVLAPLQLPDGSVVLINRGFVPPKWRARAAQGGSAPTRTATITGLLRMSEPGGAFLRHNDPAANRWYSRDVRAIAAARDLRQVAPYFIDADASQSEGGTLTDSRAARMGDSAPSALTAGDSSTRSSDAPIGGLTVIAFHNSHLAYAITWYTLALMVAAGAWVAVLEERRLRYG